MHQTSFLHILKPEKSTDVYNKESTVSKVLHCFSQSNQNTLEQVIKKLPLKKNAGLKIVDYYFITALDKNGLLLSKS